MSEKKIERCFWCGRPKDGAIEETDETLKNSVINNYIPCDDCKKRYNGGVHVIGVTKEPIVEGMFPISKDETTSLYPTGSMFVATDELIKEILSEDSDKDLLENVLKERVLMLPNDVVEDIVSDIKAAKGNESDDYEGYIEELDHVSQEGIQS